jgi:hypothetical protein
MSSLSQQKPDLGESTPRSGETLMKSNAPQEYSEIG